MSTLATTTVTQWREERHACYSVYALAFPKLLTLSCPAFFAWTGISGCFSSGSIFGTLLLRNVFTNDKQHLPVLQEYGIRGLPHPKHRAVFSDLPGFPVHHPAGMFETFPRTPESTCPSALPSLHRAVLRGTGDEDCVGLWAACQSADAVSSDLSEP